MGAIFHNRLIKNHKFIKFTNCDTIYFKYLCNRLNKNIITFTISKGLY